VFAVAKKQKGKHNMNNNTIDANNTVSASENNEKTITMIDESQVVVNTSSQVSTYSWVDGNMSDGTTHTVGTSLACSEGTSQSCENRMYIAMDMPSLPKNPRIKKAVLSMFQESGVNDPNNIPKFGLYYITGDIVTGECTPGGTCALIDYDWMKADDENGELVGYEFDITALADKVDIASCSDVNFMIKVLDEDLQKENAVTFFGSTSAHKPTLSITYELNHGMNSSYRTHTHELGRFGQGSVDLQCGNLMFEFDDFTWAGNRMPVTIKHFYNSALSECDYTANDDAGLHIADFSNMKLGLGWKLNLMQSMVAKAFVHNGEALEGFVFTDENGGETYFKQSEKTAEDSDLQEYNLFEGVVDSELLYDPQKKTITGGSEEYLFDAEGRLVKVTDEYGNTRVITYSNGRITSVTDGVGRSFVFTYDASGYLESIIAPDGTAVSYSYTVTGVLEKVTFPDGRKAVITTFDKKPHTIQLTDSNGNAEYGVTYTFFGDKVTRIIDCGFEDGLCHYGASSSYTYSLASNQTVVRTLEPTDSDVGENEGNVITTTYIFDDDGNVVSEYAYTEATGNVVVESGSSGINPYAANNGAGVVSNINNLLLNHEFKDLDNWNVMADDLDEVYVTDDDCEWCAQHGRNSIYLFNYKRENTASGVYQQTCELPVGHYTFSAYVRVSRTLVGAEGAKSGAYIRVVSADGTVLTQSEYITKSDSEHVRLAVPFELTTAQSVRVEILADGQGGVYINAPQLENNPFANDYNMLENGNFEHGTAGWTAPESSIGIFESPICFNMSKSLGMNGNGAGECNAYQDIYVKAERSTRETFTLSGWAKGYAMPKRTRTNSPTPDYKFRLHATIYYNDSYYIDDSVEHYYADFCPGTDEWQMASVQFAKEKYRVVEKVRVCCEYDGGYGPVYFDDIQLVRNSLERGLDASDFVAASDVTDAAATSTEQTKIEFEDLMDAFGNTLTETTFRDGEFGTIYRSFGFTPEKDENGNENTNVGNDLVRETDAMGNIIEYTVDETTSRNEVVTDRCGNKTAYEYDAEGRTTKVTSKNADDYEIANVSYAYDAFDNLTEIVRGDGMKYALKYNKFHNLEAIGINGKTDGDLVTYTYKNGNGRLKQMTYANGHIMKATYNDFGQLVAEKWYSESACQNLVAHYKYVYDGQGNIRRSIDILNAIEYTYMYEDGKICRATESTITIGDNEMVTGKTVVNAIRYSYDSEGNLTKKRIIAADGEEQVICYEKAENDSQVVKFTAGGKTVTSHSKTDSFGRKEFDELQLGTGFVPRQFTYYAGEVTDEHKEGEKLKSTPTTQLVSQIILSDGMTLSYAYDEEERIVSVTEKGNGIDNTVSYAYDALGQLTAELINGVPVNLMTYDNYGNILSKNGVAYTYGDTVWKDRLTAVGDKAIIYDAQGNPISYLGHSLAWEKGRQLKYFDCNTYTYNANGIRTSKTVNGVKHEYVLDGTKILRETWEDNTIIPLYDNEESVCGIIYNDVPYYFHKNLQGDIISIVDANGDFVARYSYDAWGVCSIADANTVENYNIATINPFRYRGYYYDAEIGMYYLQSRYYDPAVGRFINADEVEMMIASEEIIVLNLFAYCENDVVNNTDIVGFISLKSAVRSLVSEIIKISGKLGEYLLKTFGMSKRQYTHKLRYNNANGLMIFVNENKAKMKRFVNAFGAVGTVLEIFDIVATGFNTLWRSISYSNFVQIAELILYAIKLTLSKGLSKLIAWIISKVSWLLWWAKFLIETALDYLFSYLLSGIISLLSQFVYYLDRNNLSLGAAFKALFKSVKARI